MIEQERHGDVLVLRLAHGKASALDLELLEAISSAVEAAGAGDARAIVLTGTAQIFCAGVDLVRMVKEGADYVARFLPALDAALLAPLRCEKPVVCAINGHAIAGGAILAWTGDWRAMARGKGRIGVPELQVGVPFPVVPLEVARAAIPRQHERGMLLRGQLLQAETALEHGLLDELCEPEELLETAIARAAELGELHGPAFAATKRALHAPLLARISSLTEVQAEIARVWEQPSTLEAIADYVERTLGKKG